MSQVLTPEEMAALFEGLREAEDGPGSLYYHAPQETTPRDRVFPEPGRINQFSKFIDLADGTGRFTLAPLIRD